MFAVNVAHISVVREVSDVTAPATTHDLLLSDRTIDLESGRVHTPDEVVKLTTIETALQHYLAARAGVVVDRDELHGRVWGHGPRVSMRTVVFSP